MQFGQEDVQGRARLSGIERGRMMSNATLDLICTRKYAQDVFCCILNDVVTHIKYDRI